MSSEPAPDTDSSRRGLENPSSFHIKDNLFSPAEKSPKVLVPLCLQSILDCTPKGLCELETIPASSLQEEKEEEEQEEELERAGCCSHRSACSLRYSLSWLDARLPWPVQLLHLAVRGCRSSQGSSGKLQMLQQMQHQTRRHCTIFTEEQLQALETLFHQIQNRDIIAREHLAR